MNLTFTFAGDEAGNASLNFARGASRYFVIAVVATQDADGLRFVLEDVRERENLSQGFEFHFNSLTSEKLRKNTLLALKNANFMAWAIVVDKTIMPKPLRALTGLEFYLFMVAELISLIPANIRAKGTLILDEVGIAETTLVKLRRMFKANGIQHGFSRIFFRRSRSEDLIQIADLVAGAILRRDAKKDYEAFDYIKDKVLDVFEYNG